MAVGRVLIAVTNRYSTMHHTDLHCRDSCFGRSNLPRGIRRFGCNEQRDRCGWLSTDFTACGQEAGLVCS